MNPQQQQAANLLAGMGMGAVLFGFLFVFAILIFFVYLIWRVFAKAGLPGPLSLLILVPGFGALIVLCILAFSEWKVVPAASAYASGLPAYPPPAYPPSASTPVSPVERL